MRSARILLTAVALAVASAAPAAVPNPTVEGPITSPGGAFLQSTTIDLASFGYQQAEYFLSGTASAYTSSVPLGPDGLWTATPGATAAYKTRIVVYRPVSKKKFNGTVMIEWLNVSAGLDAAPDWTLAHTELIRSGYAWVGVSAQYVGVEGGPGLVNVVSLPLKTVNPARYGSLRHPGDSFSYDMFSQAAQAVRSPGGVNPLGDLKPKRVIALGESQSAFRMVTYINAIHPLTHLFDGYFVHSRSGIIGAPLSEAPQPAIGVAGNAVIRGDLGVPVLTFETETDLTFLAYPNAQQPDSDSFRLWEVAGTSHADIYVIKTGAPDDGTDPSIAQPVLVSSPLPGLIDCDMPINSGPQHFVVKAALAALDRWVRHGKPPASAPELQVTNGPPLTIDHDANGNALGGIRTPQVDVPIATFTGEQSGSILCRLLGTTTLLDDATLARLYPTHKDFVRQYNKALKHSVKEGWILKPDARLLKEWAAGADVGEMKPPKPPHPPADHGPHPGPPGPGEEHPGPGKTPPGPGEAHQGPAEKRHGPADRGHDPSEKGPGGEEKHHGPKEKPPGPEGKRTPSGLTIGQ